MEVSINYYVLERHGEHGIPEKYPGGMSSLNIYFDPGESLICNDEIKAIKDQLNKINDKL